MESLLFSAAPVTLDHRTDRRSDQLFGFPISARESMVVIYYSDDYSNRAPARWTLKKEMMFSTVANSCCAVALHLKMSQCLPILTKREPMEPHCTEPFHSLLAWSSIHAPVFRYAAVSNAGKLRTFRNWATGMAVVDAVATGNSETMDCRE